MEPNPELEKRKLAVWLNLINSRPRPPKDPKLGEIINDPAAAVLYLRKTTGIPALAYGTGHLLEGPERCESVVWLSGPNMDSSTEQRAHACELLGVQPTAISLMYNH